MHELMDVLLRRRRCLQHDLVRDFPLPEIAVPPENSVRAGMQGVTSILVNKLVCARDRPFRCPGRARGRRLGGENHASCRLIGKRYGSDGPPGGQPRWPARALRDRRGSGCGGCLRSGRRRIQRKDLYIRGFGGVRTGRGLSMAGAAARADIVCSEHVAGDDGLDGRPKSDGTFLVDAD